MGNDDLNENFLGAFPSNKINKLISFEEMIPFLKYPFLIANTDIRWSILNISPSNQLFLFDSFGMEGLKNFIIQDDRKIINRILKGILKMKKEDNKLTLVQLKFSELQQEEIQQLLEIAKDFFHFIKSFG